MSAQSEQELYLLLHFVPSIGMELLDSRRRDWLIQSVCSHMFSTEYKQFPSFSTNTYTKFQLPQIQVFTCTLHSCLQIYWISFLINLYGNFEVRTNNFLLCTFYFCVQFSQAVGDAFPIHNILQWTHVIPCRGTLLPRKQVWYRSNSNYKNLYIKNRTGKKVKTASQSSVSPPSPICVKQI